MENYYLATCILTSISLCLTGVTFFIIHIYRRELVTLTPCKGTINIDILELRVIYNCIGNQNITITNSYIQLDKKDGGGFEGSNNDAHRKDFKPFTLYHKDQKSILLTYKLPSFGDININEISIRINTNYIDSKGNMRCSFFHNIGNLFSNDHAKRAVEIKHTCRKLSKYLVHMSIQE